VLGYARQAQTIEDAKSVAAIDTGFLNLSEAVSTADIIVLCTPLGTYETLFREIDTALKGLNVAHSDWPIITDVGSVKGCVASAAQAVWPDLPPSFVPAHPIAGSEKSGVLAADADLFLGHSTIVTPLESSSALAASLVTRMWEAVGARVSTMSLEDHDRILAETSHLPHLVAFALVDALAGAPDRREIFQYAAGGFRDFTRIAASDVTMWHDIFLANQAALEDSVASFQSGLNTVLAALSAGDSQALCASLARAREARQAFTQVLEARGMPAKVVRPITIEEKAAGMSEPILDFYCQPGGEVSGKARVPGDKSISHRSIMLGALAEGVTRVSGFLEGEDALATLQAFRDMGITIEGPRQGQVTIHGKGLHGLAAPASVLDVGNSGTTIRLLTGLLAGQQFDVTMAGDVSLNKRPMRRVTDPLSQMGAKLETSDAGTPPVQVRGGQALTGIDYELPMASAQVKSAILLAGLYAEGETAVTEPAPTRDHTERMLTAFGVRVDSEGGRVSLSGGQTLKAAEITVPADISSAAFFLVAASIVPGSDLVLTDVGMNPTRTGIIEILKLMGADIQVENARVLGGEPVADLHVKGAQLRGIEIPTHLVPLAIDEFPVLFIAAVCASGQTVLTGAEELRVKESDRIQVMADGLARLGVLTQPTPDGIIIEGGQSIGGGVIETHHDHRIAMAFAVASLRATAPIQIRGCDAVATSFPGFAQLATTVGMRVSEQVRTVL
jgi:3-phosphoshikimate 1-carboxyvinyltransferase